MGTCTRSRHRHYTRVRYDAFNLAAVDRALLDVEIADYT
jgi:hypothetical protein